MFFAMRHEVAENRVRKGAKFPIVPEWQRTPCLKCGGVAKMDDGTVESRKCVECGFEWTVQDGVMEYGNGPSKNINAVWSKVEEGLLLVLWEKEL